MAGETVVLTGATSGIGRAAATLFARRGGVLVLQGPESEGDVGDLLAGLRADGTARIHYLQADYTRLASVTALAGAITALVDGIDVLVNNAGVPGAPTRRITDDGHERTLQVNYLALVLLSRELLPLLGRGSRIVNVSSATHVGERLDLDDLELGRGYDPVRAYARSKLAILAHSLRQSRELAPRGIDVVSLSPGVISTGLLHAMFSIGGADVEHGARNILQAATGAVHSGDYLDDGVVVSPSAEARDVALQDALAAATGRLLP